MTLHRGVAYEMEGVRIGVPDPGAVRTAPVDADVVASVRRWLSRAEGAADVHYFAVYEGGTLVGQIFLHDIDPETGEALVGYHLFERRFRGRGTGTRMLALLQRYVRAETRLHRLVVITGEDNVPSQRVALRCGFAPAGRPREDPVRGRCFAWRVPGADGARGGAGSSGGG